MSNEKPISVAGGGVTRTGIGVAINIPQGVASIRGRLSEDLYGCDSAKAIEIAVLPNGIHGEIGFPFSVHDPLNKVAASLIAMVDPSSELHIPSGTCFTATWYDDSQQWEVDDFGLCCDQGSGSESEGSEGSGGSGSGSESQHPPSAVSFITDVDYNSITGAWRKKSRVVKIPDGFLVGYETDWIDYIIGSDAGSDIQRDNTTTTATVNAGAAYGDPTTITVTVSPPESTSGTSYGTPTGSVAFRAYYGAKQIQLVADSGSPYLAAGSGNTATATITTHLPPGIWTILAEYGGDASYNQSTFESYNHSQESGTQYTVAHAPTSVNIQLDNATPVYGTPITVTAYVNTEVNSSFPFSWGKHPDGYLAFYLNNVLVGHTLLEDYSFDHYGAKAVLTAYSDWHELAVGAHTLKVAYVGAVPGDAFVDGSTQTDEYYANSYATTTVTVSKKPLNVAAGVPDVTWPQVITGYTRNYGDNNPVFTPVYTGFVYGQAENVLGGHPHLETTATATSDVGVYDVTAAVGTLASDNYSFTFSSAHLTINKIAISASVANAGMIYGATVPEFVITILGRIASDIALITGTTICTGSRTSPPSDYVIAVGLTDGDHDKLKNYWSPTLTNGLLTITKASLSVTASSQSMTIDGSLPAFDGNITGQLNSDGITFHGSCSATGHVLGAFTIYAGITDPNGRQGCYAISYHNSTLTVHS